jgi:hypothetical protein
MPVKPLLGAPAPKAKVVSYRQALERLVTILKSRKAKGKIPHIGVIKYAADLCNIQAVDFTRGFVCCKTYPLCNRRKKFSGVANTALSYVSHLKILNYIHISGF